IPKLGPFPAESLSLVARFVNAERARRVTVFPHQSRQFDHPPEVVNMWLDLEGILPWVGALVPSAVDDVELGHDTLREAAAMLLSARASVSCSRKGSHRKPMPLSWFSSRKPVGQSRCMHDQLCHVGINARRKALSSLAVRFGCHANQS